MKDTFKPYEILWNPGCGFLMIPSCQSDSQFLDARAQFCLHDFARQKLLVHLGVGKDSSFLEASAPQFTCNFDVANLDGEPKPILGYSMFGHTLQTQTF